MKPKKKAAKLQRRQEAYEHQQGDKKGFTKPGSLRK